ncbi:hypothetical protein O181_113787 [Austropuccinia psidii MF-1]|uniref:Uncharacterized protein n=1 Tax=Austropuccinia psidii MF-1 TaxID=1389203 RepID=A0A9Q3PVQ3_9BASI|nr:hypothetical protein [Austropuccinia psidii MF-1]
MGGNALPVSMAVTGGHELLLAHQELAGSGEDHTTLREVETIVLKRKGKKDKELVEKPKYFICRPEEGIGNDPSFGRKPSGVYQLQTSTRSIQREAQRTSEEEERPQEPSGKGKRQGKLAQISPTRVQDPQIGTFSCEKCLQYGQNSWNSQPKSRKGLTGLFHTNNT